jgi:hypothetical protein
MRLVAVANWCPSKPKFGITMASQRPPSTEVTFMVDDPDTYYEPWSGMRRFRRLQQQFTVSAPRTTRTYLTTRSRSRAIEILTRGNMSRRGPTATLYLIRPLRANAGG